MKKLVKTDEDVQELLRRLQTSTVVGLDTESAGPKLIRKKFVNMAKSTTVGFSLAFPDGSSYYVPIAHQVGSISLVLARRILTTTLELKVVFAHNWKHDLVALSKILKTVPTVPGMQDTLILAWMLGHSADGKSPYGLKSLSKHFLGMEMEEFEKVAKGKSFDTLHPQDALNYACDDARATLVLGLRWLKEIRSLPRVNKVYETIERPLLRVLLEMEERGVGLDDEKLTQVYENIRPQMDRIESRWEELLPGVLIRSPKQLNEALYASGHWSTKGLRKGKSGLYPTTAHVVAKHAEHCTKNKNSLGEEAARLKLEYNFLHKNANTYTVGLIELANQYPDGCLHPSYNQTGTATGRLSSSYPNAQNIPAHTDLGKKILECFVPSEASYLVSADYSQIELRVLARLSGGAFFKAYKTGVDVHQQTAELLGVSRTQGKTLNFAMLYGAHDKKLAEQLNVSKDRAREIREGYWRVRPQIAKFKAKVLDKAYKNGYVETWTGRRRHLLEMPDRCRDESNSCYKGAQGFRNLLDKWGDERKAFNTVIQGGAADVVKLGMLKAHKAGLRISTQIHDDVRIESDEPEKDAQALQQALETCVDFDLPLVAEPAIGKNWKEMKE